jgi:pacifastin inhibitor LCMII
MNRLLGGSWLVGLGGWLFAVGCAPASSEVGKQPDPDAGSMLPDGGGGEGNGGEVCKEGESRLADDGCNSCTCENGGWACTEIGCATCQQGEMRAAGDGCNTCSCLNGAWACTQKACGDGGGECKVGETKSDGCSGCVCQDFGQGPMWACTANVCTECTPGQTRPADDGCNNCQCTADGKWACTLIDCQTCVDGETRDAGDGCNTCVCKGNRWSCTADGCSVGCKVGFADCDGDPANGCETDLMSSVVNCGTCGAYCALAGATSLCVAGKCELDACIAGYADCDQRDDNGCESLVGKGGCEDRCEVPSNAPALTAPTGSCDCPDGSTCVRHSLANPDGDYCIPMPKTCPGYGNCACMAPCACGDGAEQTCTEQMQIGGRMIADCTGTLQ